MCNSLEASIRSSVISFITCIVLYIHTFNQNKETHLVFQNLAIFFFFVSLMQWYDTIFWLNQTKNDTNYIFTKIAMITNHLQPIVLSFLVSRHFNINILAKIITLIYTIYAIFYSIYAYNNIDYTLVTERSSPVLDWKWNTLDHAFIMYALFLSVFTSISFQLPYPINILMIILNIGSFGLSYYTTKRTTIGKLWCIFASYIPLLLIAIEMMYKF